MQKSVCKLLKEKETRGENAAKRGARGGKCLKTWELTMGSVPGRFRKCKSLSVLRGGELQGEEREKSEPARNGPAPSAKGAERMGSQNRGLRHAPGSRNRSNFRVPLKSKECATRGGLEIHTRDRSTDVPYGTDFSRSVVRPCVFVSTSALF